MTQPHSNIEWWDLGTVQREGESFVRRYGALEGKTAAELRHMFGEWDELIAAGQKRVTSGVVTLVADSLRYHTLLPHTTVAFAVYQGVVHHYYFAPKVRQCSPERRAPLGKAFAPE